MTMNSSQQSNNNSSNDDNANTVMNRSSADEMIESITKRTPIKTTLNTRKEGKTMEVLTMERERLNESKYRDLYRTLLTQNYGLFQQQEAFADNETILQTYQEETSLLRKALICEQNAFIMGIVVGASAFVSIRVAPRLFIARFGGADKIQKLKEADELAKKHNTKWIQSAFSVIVEGSFSFWLGIRAYQMAAATSDSAFEMISEIPLVQGRSVVSDTLCTDWVRITKQEIPSTFWDNLDQDDSKLHQERTWHAIRTFSQNCIRRKLYERLVAKEQDGDVTLPNRVPEFALLSDGQQLTAEQALQLVSDQ